MFRKSNDFTTDGNVTEGTTNPTLIPADHWEIIALTGSNLTYGDEAGNNVNLQRYKHTLSTPVVLEPVAEGTEGDMETEDHYGYTLNFTDEGVGKHDPENPEKGGDDILGDYIWFTVTVDDWIPTDQTPEL